MAPTASTPQMSRLKEVLGIRDLHATPASAVILDPASGARKSLNFLGSRRFTVGGRDFIGIHDENQRAIGALNDRRLAAQAYFGEERGCSHRSKLFEQNRNIKREADERITSSLQRRSSREEVAPSHPGWQVYKAQGKR